MRPGIGKVRIGLLALAVGFLVATIALTYDVLRRPWPNTVYSASADGMVLRIKGQIESGDGSGFALRVAAAVVKMWAGGTDQPLIVELNSGGGDTGAAQMMAYSLLFANLVTPHGTATVVGRESACFSACTFLFAAGKRRNADATALFMFHQPHTPDRLTGAPEPGKSDWAKRADWLTGRTLSWVSFRSPQLADFLVSKGFYTLGDCFLSAPRLAEFPGYLTGYPGALSTGVSPPPGYMLDRAVVHDPSRNSCHSG